MRTVGTRWGGGARKWRLLTSVLALYALVLTSMLGTISGLVGPAPGDVLCLQMATADSASDSQPGKVHRHANCCTAACVPTALEPPSLAANAIVWPARLVTRLDWRMDGDSTARAPPGTIASPRAPPVA